MRKIVVALILSSITWASCTKQKTIPPLTKEELKQKVDSIMAIKNKQLEDAAKIDLDHRLKIEVKVKVDSILNARNNPVQAAPIPANKINR